MKELALYFNDAAEVVAHLEQLLLTLVASPFFASLPPEERSLMVLKHIEITRQFRAQVWP